MGNPPAIQTRIMQCLQRARRFFQRSDSDRAQATHERHHTPAIDPIDPVVGKDKNSTNPDSADGDGGADKPPVP